jgi:hypothetical protein
MSGECGILRAKEPFEDIQPAGPEALVGTQPLVGAGKRPRIQSAEMGSPSDFAPNETGRFQHLDVFGGGGKRYGERLGQLADRPFTVRELGQHAAARFIAKGVKYCVEGICR